MDFDTIRNRLFEALEISTQTELAQILGITKATTSKARARNKIPAHWYQKLSIEYSINPKWVETGRGPKFIHEKQVEGSDLSVPEGGSDKYGEDIISIPQCQKPDQDRYYYIPMAEAHLSAGGGEFVISEGVRDYYAFRKPFIKWNATSPRNLVLMRVSGNSMEPKIDDGDTVMIDIGRRHIKSGCYYAIGFGDSIAVKELERLPGERVRVISKNSREYPAYEVDIHDIRVIGQVIWGDRKFPH